MVLVQLPSVNKTLFTIVFGVFTPTNCQFVNGSGSPVDGFVYELFVI